MKRTHYAAQRNIAREQIITRKVRIDELRRQGRIKKIDPVGRKPSR